MDTAIIQTSVLVAKEISRALVGLFGNIRRLVDGKTKNDCYGT